MKLLSFCINLITCTTEGGFDIPYPLVFEGSTCEVWDVFLLYSICYTKNTEVVQMRCRKGDFFTKLYGRVLRVGKMSTEEKKSVEIDDFLNLYECGYSKSLS